MTNKPLFTYTPITFDLPVLNPGAFSEVLAGLLDSVKVTDTNVQYPYLNEENQQKLLIAVLANIFPDHAWDDNVEETARRVLGYWEEYAGRDGIDELPFTATTFGAVSKAPVHCVNIHFSSICAHHLLPFTGVAHVGYIPQAEQIGISKIPRLVDHIATRPQSQEQLTKQIADALDDMLDPIGVIVAVHSRHTCMSCRGVRAHTASMQTFYTKGTYRVNPNDVRAFNQMVYGGSI